MQFQLQLNFDWNLVFLWEEEIHCVMFGAKMTDPDISAGNIKIAIWTNFLGSEFFNNLGIEMLETVMFV